MSRSGGDYDDWSYDVEDILQMGRWERNSRATLRSKRGQKALRAIRAALLELPEKRLIEGAFCTVNREQHQELEARRSSNFYTPEEIRADEKRDDDQAIGAHGVGVCVLGAYAWHRAVRDGMNPDEAFARLPTMADDAGYGIDDTASEAEDELLCYTLAWNLADENDHTFGAVAPEARYDRFLLWLDRLIKDEVPA